MTFEDILLQSPYSLNQELKEKLLTERLSELTRMHKSKCKLYSNILDSMEFDPSLIRSYKDIPFLPVRLFKDTDLKSVEDDQVIKTMTSSGTSGQKVSRIYLDRTTASNQQKTMIKIVSSFTGAERMPMIIIDCPSVVKNRNLFSARGAGILGFSMFGSKKIYALKDDMTLDVDAITAFLEEHKDKKILLFGFTFMIWQYFYKELKCLKEKGIEFDLSNSILIHGGGWKKLVNEAVTPSDFHDMLNAVCKIDRIHDFYGMVEQTGCIYMQCECGHLHASIFSDVIVRDPKDFSECEIGKRGLIQVVSTIPESYPGHSLLTEDEGTILGVDDCPCGRKGKYFAIHGRIKKAEIRGCSDTFAENVSRMKRSEDNAIEYVLGDSDSIDALKSVRPMAPFNEYLIEFCNSLSSKILKDKEARAFPDVVTLGFWLRNSSLLSMKSKFTFDSNGIRYGRGVLFHIAPSNVPVNYAYSLFAGLICGNANIVRIPSKDFPQVSIINRLISETLVDHEDIRPYINLVKYEREKSINDKFSSLCDVRIIWGGDSTINALRESPLNPRATEVAFADRFSIAIIDSDSYMNRFNTESNGKFVKELASGFYNDTYLSDQNACTSPRVVIWTGNCSEGARELFWSSVQSEADSRYILNAVQSVDKYAVFCLAASQNEDNRLKLNKNSAGNLLVRVDTERLDSNLMKYRGNSGYFYEYMCKDIKELYDICNDVRCQTIGLLGKSDLLLPLFEMGIKGVDRVVEIGNTLDFNLIWDGYNLVDRFTRVIDMQTGSINVMV